MQPIVGGEVVLRPRLQDVATMRRRSPLPFAIPAELAHDALRVFEVGVAAPQVIALRCAQMFAAGMTPGPRDRAEFTRMGSEKVRAFTQGWMAMAVAGWWYPVEVALALLRNGPFSLAPWPYPRAFGNALAPVHRRVRANYRRLTRARRS